jgi:hypothetical protein
MIRQTVNRGHEYEGRVELYYESPHQPEAARNEMMTKILMMSSTPTKKRAMALMAISTRNLK